MRIVLALCKRTLRAVAQAAVSANSLEVVPDHLRGDRVDDGRIDELGSLNSIISPTRYDMVDNSPFVSGDSLDG